MTEASLSSLFLSSTSDRPRLRVGLLVDGTVATRVSAAILSDLLAADFVEVALIVDGFLRSVPAGRVPPVSSADRRRRSPALGRAAFDLYARLDRRRLGLHDDPLARIDCSSLLAGIEEVRVGRADANGDRLGVDDVAARIRDARIDLIVDLAGVALPDPIRAAARLGVWTLEFGDGDRHRGGPPCFWESVEGQDVCGARLVRTAAGPAGLAGEQVLAAAWFATDRGSLSRTRRAVCYGAVHLVISSLWRLHQLGWEALSARLPAVTAARAGAAPRDPTLRSMAAWLLPLSTRKAVGAVRRRLARDREILHWRIAIRTGHLGRGGAGPPDMTGFRWIESPAGRFWADPFVIERDGRTWLFIEDFSYADGRGVISCSEVSAGGAISDPVPVLRIDGHLSYPMVVADGPGLWMIPESASDGCVRVHRSTDPPWRWEAVAEPFTRAAVDTSVWAHDGRWWFATTVVDGRSGAGALMLFFADSVDGPWTPHPMNPISQDVRACRGGGAPYRADGRLIRPSQDGSRGYGFGFALNEIVLLSTTEYVERRVAWVGPDWAPGIVGTHTYNRAGDVEVTDGKVTRARRSVV